MARYKEREEALKLRRQGMSYSQIKKILGVGKGTLSCWLNKYPLSKERIRELKDVNEVRIERFRTTMKHKKDTRLNKIYKKEKAFIFPLKNRDLYLGGLFLYWGEGSKSQMSVLGVSNTDPAIIKFFIKWLTICLKIPKNKLKVHLHLYKDMDVEKEMNYWSTTLTIPNKQFNKPYIKQSSLTDINHKGGFGHGTCNVRICNVRLAEKILMTIKAISDKYIR